MIVARPIFHTTVFVSWVPSPQVYPSYGVNVALYEPASVPLVTPPMVMVSGL